MDSHWINSLLNTLKEALGVPGLDYPCHLQAPYLRGNEQTVLNECLNSTLVSSVGPLVEEFEQAVADFTGAKYAVATVNGTAALHLGLLTAGVEAGDEVLTTPMSFIATSNAIHYCKATPHYVDIEPDSLAIDADALSKYLHRIAIKRDGITINRDTGRPIRALCVVHVFGLCANLPALQAVCEAFDIVLVEDAAEALGSCYQATHVGHWGRSGAISFNGNKIITTGGGGMLLTDDPAVAQAAKHLSTTAKVADPFAYEHDQVGYNYRMPNLNAALGLAQLEQLPQILQLKRQIHAWYQEAFADHPQMRLLTAAPETTSNYWLNALVLSPAQSAERERLLVAAHQRQLFLRPVWNLHHQLSPYQHCPRATLAVAEALAPRIVNLPSSAELAA